MMFNIDLVRFSIFSRDPYYEPTIVVHDSLVAVNQHILDQHY